MGKGGVMAAHQKLSSFDLAFDILWHRQSHENYNVQSNNWFPHRYTEIHDAELISVI